MMGLTLDASKPSLCAAADFKIDASPLTALGISKYHGRILVNHGIIPSLLKLANIHLMSDKFDGNLADHIVQFLKVLAACSFRAFPGPDSFRGQNDKSGTTEFSLIARDDCLVHVMIAGTNMRRQRNKSNTSTKARTRTDSTAARDGCTPLVIVEEKALDGSLDEAANELIAKFEWLPHYGLLPWIIGVAIAGDSVRFVRLLSGGGSEPCGDAFDLSKPEDRVKFVKYVLSLPC